MLKVAIFTEGQSELIFTREFLHRLFHYEKVHIKCLEFNAGNEIIVPYEITCPNPDCYIQICNIGNDSKVVSYIIYQYKRLKEQNFEIIVGLRDIFSEEFKNISDSGTINQILIDQFINVQNNTLQENTSDENLTIFFAVMEFESWLLSFPDLFEKINPELTNQCILDELGVDIRNNCPDKTFFHPTTILLKILNLANIKYDKSRDQINQFVHNIISLQDIANFEDINTSSPSLINYHSFLQQIVKKSIIA